MPGCRQGKEEFVAATLLGVKQALCVPILTVPAPPLSSQTLRQTGTVLLSSVPH